MPKDRYKIRKLPNQNKYRVYNARTGEITAYRTSKKKAKMQKRLLESIE